ncbi:MAG: hypothetical protein IT204_06595 [Fimbriimonadaceae bacterium]|nr:hypothetical protein [Fimbriimonadaceae bacterium]
MPDPRRVVVFAEDTATDQYGQALLERLGGEGGVSLEVVSAVREGGAARAVNELVAYQRRCQRRGVARGPVDLGVVILDADRKGWADSRKRLLQAIDPATFPLVAVGCPDPHVERWYLADRSAFRQTYGAEPATPSPGRPGTDCKRLILEALRAAGDPLPRLYPSAAGRLVQAQDLERAGREVAELDHFIKELRAALQRLAG